MKTRRTVSLLLLISFAASAATGVLFCPAIRFLVGIKNESFWRMVHFYSTNTLFFLTIEHVILNRKALGNYLRTARTFSIVFFALAVVIFAGIIFHGLFGSNLGIAAPWREAELYLARTEPEPTLISFPEDFEDGQADGWNLGKGWEAELEDNTYVLSCTSDAWSEASPQAGDGWFDNTLEARVKVINGKFQIRFRTSDQPYRSAYTLHFNEDGVHLGRVINGEHTGLGHSAQSLEYDRWYRVSIVLNKTNIKVYLDDEMILDCTDSDLPLIFGGIAFNTGPDSHVLYDDINVEVH